MKTRISLESVESNFDWTWPRNLDVVKLHHFFETAWNGVEKELAAALSLIKLSSVDRKYDEDFFKRLRISVC